MLVVTRKKHEYIQIGEDVFIKIIKTGRSSVKIGIDAPGGKRVLRGEMCLEELDEFIPMALGKLKSSAHAEPEVLHPCGVI